MGMLAVGGFLVERATTLRVVQSGTALRGLTEAQRAAWEAESAARAFILVAEPDAPRRGRSAQTVLRDRLRAVRTETVDNGEQQDRLRALDTAIDQWERVFLVPSFTTGIATRELAIEGTRAFDEVTRHFDELVSTESELRLERIDRQRLVRRITLALLLLALLISAIAFAWIGRELETVAEQGRRERQRAEDQANELAEQASQLEEQAATLEEQTAELEHRLVEREDAARLMQQMATFLDSALESAPIGIAFYDRALRFQRVNDALARINGAPAAAHIGRSIDEMIPALAPTIRPILERVLATGRIEPEVIVEGETPAEPGARRRWVVTYYPIATAGREPVGVGCMVLDVTERSLLEEQLRQAQKMEAVGRLAGGIAHDFNNILTIVQSYAELLAADLPVGSRGREEVDAIRSAADRATALARQLLSFSRREVVIPRDLDVSETVRGMEGILRRLLRQGMSLELALDDEPLLVRIDAGQLEQVLMNLAINAVDAMPDGGTLRIATERSATLPRPEGERQQPAAVLRVTDSGTGMSKQVQERLFEPFFTTKPAGKGTGLGLATTYAIVLDCGGYIRVHSVVGEGSSFTVFLPLSGATRLEPPTRPSPLRGIPATRVGETVLVAEDEDAIRHAISRVLSASGYRVLAAADGAEALRLAAEEPGPIHLLLTDVMMPGMGGKELVQRLRQTRPATRVVLMSGYTDDEPLRAELGDARYVFLQKPFAARQVVMTVREILDAG